MNKMPEERKQGVLARIKIMRKERRKKADPITLAKHQRNRILKYRYGISQLEYEQKLESQKNVCAICETTWEAKHPLYVDHNHSTGQTRGLLCAKCNTQVGIVETGNITKVMEYINSYDNKK